MSNGRDITVIAGLSGVGKTYVIKALMRESDAYTHFSAGSLIKKRLASLDRDQLRELDKDSILANQYLLVEQFNEEVDALSKECAVLFDAHMIIDNDEHIIEVPYEIFERLSPVRIVFLFDDAEKIIQRREGDNSRKRPLRAVEEIAKQQERSIAIAKEYSNRLSIPFVEIHAGDVSTLAATLKG